jgi:hypothetical protein
MDLVTCRRTGRERLAGVPVLSLAATAAGGVVGLVLG